jgi:hypothetical protein
MEQEVLSRLAACERANHRLSRIVGVLLFAMAGGVLASCISTARAESSDPQVLTVSELRVVDGRGVVRVRIGGDLPDAIVRGKRTPRGDRAAGVLVYDTTGQERGGYVTLDRSGIVGLTLDRRNGQTGQFWSDTVRHTALRLWNGGDVAELRVGTESGRINVLRGGQLPEITDPASTSTCSDLRELRAQHEAEIIMNACLRTMPAAVCQKCLNRP